MRLAPLLTLLLLGAPLHAQSQPPRVRVAVLELEGPAAIPPQALSYLTDLLRARLSTLPSRFLLLTKENILALLPPGRDLADCEGACEVETGRNLGVSYVVTGAVIPLGGELRLSLKLHETISGALLSASGAAARDQRALEGAIQRASGPIFEALRARHPGARPQPASAPTRETQIPLAVPLADRLSYEEAIAFERTQASAADKAAAWGRHARASGWLGAEARARQRHWRREAKREVVEAAQTEARAARMGRDWARLRRLLDAKEATPPQRRKLAEAFVATYGEDPARNPHYGDLLPYLGDALVTWARIPGDPSRHIPAFELSRAEITVAVYRRCVELGRCTPPGSWPGCNWGVAGRDDHPVNCVSRAQARRFAAWIGARLPTAAEWRLAAGPQWPWGAAAPTCTHAALTGAAPNCARGTLPACARPAGASVHGVCDLIGNVEEWLDDGAHLRVGGGFMSPANDGLRRPIPGAPLDGSATGFRVCRALQPGRIP